MQFYLTAIILALSLVCMGWGIYISMKISGLPDITTDGSYTLGAAVCASSIQMGLHWSLAMTMAAVSGWIAGSITGIIYTRLKVQALLAGILVMTGLYSANLMIMGRSNIPLDEETTVFSAMPALPGPYLNQLLVLILVCTIVGLGLYWFLRTDAGIALRATGNAPTMARSFGINTGFYQTNGLAIANTLTALSGALVAQVQLFADINMGIGIVIFGLGAVMIGESLLGKALNLPGAPLLAVILGCILFRLIIAFSLQIGADPLWLRLITSLVVLAFVAIPALKQHKHV